MDAAAPLPYHAQVRESLRTRILEGVYTPEQQLPSENDLTSLYEVSRITVRRALLDLENEGLVQRLQGRGTFVRRPQVTQDLARLQSFGEAMRPLGHETASRLLSVREVKPPQAVAQRLGVTMRSKVSEIRRVRYLSGTPVSLDVSYFSTTLGRRLAAEDLASRDIFLILEHDYGLSLGHADLLIGARLADEALVEHLGVALGSAVLYVDRLTTDLDGQPLACEHLFNNGDAYQYHLQVARDVPKPLSTPPKARSST
ncbi:GntR family transcriptional regulator [Piscinibacter gummiphilus]|uniref:GntR family transcriptional regulator n=1 Tax=Piscinibacter gummiphilus TaxID=946333 RepID=A0ABZ0CQD7_9BURK|nr:GntR family transcriptional regulator [Piscinibacter gummiphilus]WOB07104.1 GntR family transcriptional regulator [Piscinibacter gummiphilus]